jgi:hypothetical protein
MFCFPENVTTDLCYTLPHDISSSLEAVLDDLLRKWENLALHFVSFLYDIADLGRLLLRKPAAIPVSSDLSCLTGGRTCGNCLVNATLASSGFVFFFHEACYGKTISFRVNSLFTLQ